MSRKLKTRGALEVAEDHGLMTRADEKLLQEMRDADPKPPAASGDRYDEMAARAWTADPDDLGAVLRQTAKEAQLRLLEHLEFDLKGVRYMSPLRARIEKEGPL